jgi:hypothetical protein
MAREAVVQLRMRLNRSSKIDTAPSPAPVKSYRQSPVDLEVAKKEKIGPKASMQPTF